MEKTTADRDLRVERETILEAAPEEVWEALTEESRLAEWLADDAELDPVEGGEVRFGFADGERAGRVERVEEERSFAFTWTRPGEGPSRVEFTIEAVPAGTRLVVVESGLSGPAAMASAAATAEWWVAKLGALGAILALVPA